VLIHFAFMPILELIMSPQKNLARARPIIDFLLVCNVQFSALVLSVTHNTTGCGSSLIFLGCKNDKGCTIIHDDGHIFETVD
jgi:hypothetical protein